MFRDMSYCMVIQNFRSIGMQHASMCIVQDWCLVCGNDDEEEAMYQTALMQVAADLPSGRLRYESLLEAYELMFCP